MTWRPWRRKPQPLYAIARGTQTIRPAQSVASPYLALGQGEGRVVVKMQLQIRPRTARRMAEMVEANPATPTSPGWIPMSNGRVGAGRAHFFREGRQQRWLPVAPARLKGISPRDFADGGQCSSMTVRASPCGAHRVRVSPLYTSPRRSEVARTFCTAMVSQGFFEFMKRNGRLRDSSHA